MNNTELIAKYIEKGCKGQKNDTVGIELEHFAVNKKNRENIGFYGDKGIGKMLEKMSVHFDRKYYSDGILIALANERYSITLEPSAQLEISLVPVDKISDAQAIYEEFRELIEPFCDEFDCELVCEGYRQTGLAEELELIPKKRYEFMNKYFEKTGTCGKNMMRATASAQISIDYADENDFSKKFYVANILSPIFALICDNSRYFEGKLCEKRMVRTYIWQNVDRERCGVVPFDKNFTFKDYAEYIYKRPAILIVDDGNVVFTDDKPISEIYSSRIISDGEIEHLLSMFFPDVRLKKYIEIRPADSMPIEYTLAYAALIKGIFADCSELVFDNIGADDVENAKVKLIKDGFDAEIYGRKAYEICDMMIETAKNNLTETDRKYLTPIEKLISARKTLKEII